MMAACAGIMVVALVVIFAVRNFFVQLIAIKLLLDVLIVLLCCMRAPERDDVVFRAAGWMVASLGVLAFFVLAASGARRFARSVDLNLEADID